MINIKVYPMNIKFLLSTLVLLFTYTTTFGQTPTAIDLEIDGGGSTTICRGTTIQINATITPPDPGYYYNWTNITTGQNYNPWPVGQGGSGQGDDHSFLLLTDLQQSSTIQLQVNGVNQTIDIVVVDSPNPGTDGSLLLCNQAGTINLFNILQGAPDAGGTWNPPLSGGNGDFIVGTDAPGEYIYTINGNAPCPNAEAKVTVRECLDLDFDNDGVPNDVDLDDDNDGILDAVENAICTAGTLTETRPIVDIDFGQGNVPTTDPNVVGHNRSPIWPNDGFYNVGTSTFFGTSDNFEPTFVMTNANPIANSDGSGDIDGRYLAININNGYVDQPIYRITDIPIQNGTEYNFRIDIAGLCDGGCANAPILDLELIDQNLPPGSPPIFQTTSTALGVLNDDIWRTLLLNFNADRTTFLTLLITNQQPQGGNGNDVGIDNIRFAQLECDFDLDEIPNYLDLDSDNDGIFDIIEAGNPAVIDANNDGIADGPVGANGVPISAGAGTIPVNTDGTTFADFLDIDADNDGIQDNIEGQGTFTYIAPSGNDTDRNGVDDVYDMANNPVTPEDTDGDNTPDYLDLNSDDDCLDDNIEAYDLNQDGIADILPAGADADNDGLDNNYDTVVLNVANSVTNPSDGNEVPTALPDNHNPGDDVDFRDEFEELLEEIELDFCSGLTTPINLFDSLVLTAIPGGDWSGPSILTGGELGTFDPTVNTAGVYTYTLPIIGNCPERKAEITITLGTDPDTGTDGTVSLCETDNAIDLFDSLGGTPNAGGEWTPPLASGTGIFDPSIDVANTYTYTIAFPGCASSSTDVVVTINSTPNAGEDSDLDICSSGTSIDLFTLILGNPDTGGTWTPNLASGTGVFDPTVDIGGTYTYTVAGTNPCPDDTSQIIVNLIDDPDAGLDSAITLCDSGNAVDLFTLLGGTPDTGGTWTPNLASGTGIFDPSIDNAGIYTYTVSVIGCADDTSEVLVGVNTTPDAGTDGNIEICETNNPVDLFTILGGTPDASGTWTPPLASGTGVFNPNIDPADTYTYTINGPASCSDASAQVIVNIINVPNPGTDGTVILCNNNDAIDLFNSLGGTPDTGGTWSPMLTSGTGVFDPSLDAAGPYTYTINSTSCGEARSEATVTVNPAVNAGENAALSTCDTGNTVNLFDLIGGTPDTGGIWTPALTSGTNIFDPTIDIAGTYTYTVAAIAPCLDDASQVVVTFDNTLTLIQPDNLRLCDTGNDTVEAFNLEQQTTLITADNLDYTVTYHISQPDANTGVNPLISPYNNIANPQTIFTRVREITTGCIDTSITFNIELEDGVIANPDTYELCDDNMEFDGDPTNDSTVFNLISRNAIVLGPAQAPANFTVSYHLTQNDADNGINALPASYENTINTQTIFARVENIATSCYNTSEVVLKVNPIPSFTIDDSYTICIDPNGTQVIPPPIINTGLTTANYTFEWSLDGVIIAGEINGSITPPQIGNYSVIVTDNTTGCVSNGINTVVIESAPPILTAQQISLTFVEDNTILATASNGGSVTTFYEFSLDNGPWVFNTPNNNTYTFEDVTAGEHTITARDLNGCGESSVTILVIDYIPYFTPNADGYHDTWKITGIESQPDAKIYIFNRFGKLLKELSPLGTGWDGTYNNETLPTSDYWFTVDYREPNTDERKEFKAHFTLKR